MVMQTHCQCKILLATGLWICITVKQSYSPAGFAFNPASCSSIAERMNLKYERSRGANAAPAFWLRRIRALRQARGAAAFCLVRGSERATRPELVENPVRRLQRAAASTARASARSDRGRAGETDLPWVESYLYGTVRKVFRRRLWTRVDNMTINKPNSIMA